MRVPSISRRQALLLAGIVVIMITVVCIYKNAASPAAGTVKNVRTSGVKQKAASPKEVQGKYISFSYPGSYIATASSKPSGTQLETFDFVNRNTSPFSTINISVLSLPSGKLSDDGSYNYRSVNPATYTPDTWTVNEVSVPIMNEVSGGYAKVAYVVHGSLVAEISVRGGGSLNLNQLDSDMRSVLSSLKWLRIE